MNRFISIALVLYVSVNTGANAAAEGTTAVCGTLIQTAATTTGQEFSSQNYGAGTGTGYTIDADTNFCTYTLAAPSTSTYKIIFYVSSISLTTSDTLDITDDVDTAIGSQLTSATTGTVSGVVTAGKGAIFILTVASAAASHTGKGFTIQYLLVQDVGSNCLAGPTPLIASTTAAYVVSNFPYADAALSCVWTITSTTCVKITPMIKDIATTDSVTLKNVNAAATETSLTIPGTAPYYTSTASVQTTDHIAKLTFVKAGSGTQAGIRFKYESVACGVAGIVSSPVAIVMAVASLLLAKLM